MSTSIAANVGPRASGPESYVPHAAAAQQHEEETRKDNPSPAESVAFTTPVIKVDNSTGLALLVVRDGSTGEELDQYPSKKVVEEYKRVQGTSQSTLQSSVPSDGGAAVAANAPVGVVAAPPVSPATGDARTTTVSAVTGAGAATNS